MITSFENNGTTVILTIHFFIVDIFEHIITSLKGIGFRIRYTDKMMKGKYLIKYQYAILLCKKSVEVDVVDHYTLGDDKVYVPSKEFWEF